MKSLFILTILSLSSFAFSAAEWKVIAESSDCAEKVQILAKEGEKYVMAVKGEVKNKLVAKDGSAFKKDNMKSTEFVSEASTENTDSKKDGSMTFIQPAYVEGNPAKLDTIQNGKVKRCNLNSK